MLTVQNLVKRFGPSTVLDGVSLHLHAGQVLGLLGRSGCGKSTLARCIAGIDRADSGALLLQGENQHLPSERTRAQRRRIQYVWQEPQRALSPYRSAQQAVAESIEGFALAPPRLHAAQAAQWLARMQIDAAAMQRRPDALSGGQCQRVVLARALAAQPDVLLLDEPFSALDTVATAGLLQLLTDTFAQRRPAVLLVSHDRAVLRRLAPRSLLLHGGRLSESAT